MSLKRSFPILIALILTLSSVQPARGEEPTPWRGAITAIEHAKSQALLSVDEAALLRLQALKDPQRLPEKFRPPEQPLLLLSDGTEEVHCGLPEIAAAIDLLLIDQDAWTAETEGIITDEIDAALATPPDLDQEYETEHFVIHWADDGLNKPPGGIVYIFTLAQELELAWRALKSAPLNYPELNPQQFGVPQSSDGAYRFPIDVVEDIKIVLDINATAVSLPGKMWFDHGRDRQFLDVDAAHELFHMVQWAYAGYTDSSSIGHAAAFNWYRSDSAWLMESTSNWIEKEIYPASDNWTSRVASFINFPEQSLFDITPLVDQHEYGAVIFIDFLEEHLAREDRFGEFGYSPEQEVVKNIWEKVPLRDRRTIDAVTHELLNPPSSQQIFSSPDDVWQSLFDDFAIANYRRDYDQGSDWPGLVNRSEMEPEAGEMSRLNLMGYERGAARYVVLTTVSLGLPGGADATGATVHLTLTTDCVGCTLDVLQDPKAERLWFLPVHDTPMDAVVSDDFGAPGGDEELVFILANGIDPVFLGAEYQVLAIDNPPIAPDALAANVRQGPPKAIRLTWGVVEEDEIHYRVFRDTASNVTIDEQHLLAELQDLEYEDGNAAPGTTYYYVVTAVDQGGNEGPPSNQVSALIPAPTPTPTPTPTSSSITIEISAGVDDAGPNPECQFNTSRNEIYFGECNDGRDIISGFRFANVPIPSGAEIQEAYLRFTTNGPYYNPLSLLIYGEASANAASFSSASKPADRPRTAASAGWPIISSDHWGLGNETLTPDLSSVLQEIVDGSGWASGNAVAFLVADNGDEGGRHRRVIGIERDPSTYHPAQLVITYLSSGGGVPGPTATPRPSPTPTEDPGGGGGCTLASIFGIGVANEPSLARRVAMRVRGLLALDQVPWEMIETLQAVRDQIMVHTAEGQHFVDLYVENSPEMTELFLAHDEVWEQGLETIDFFLPAFEAMLDGRADELVISEEQAQAVLDFLAALEAVASPELQQVIQEERQALDAESLIGQSFADVQGELLANYPPTASIENPGLVLEGGEVLLAGQADDPEGGLSFYWDLDADGEFELEGQMVLFSALLLDGPTNALVALKVCDAGGACDVTEIEIEIVNVPPAVTIVPPDDVLEGSLISFAGTIEDPMPFDTHKITWEFGDDQGFEDLLYPVHVYGDNGVYTVQLVVVDDDGGRGEASVEVEVQNLPPELTLDTSGSYSFLGGPAFLGRVGEDQTHQAEAEDQGSDDLVFIWSTGQENVYYNDGYGPDPELSPKGIFPFTVQDSIEAIFADPGVIQLSITVHDDDVGSDSVSFQKIVTGAAECTRSQGYWKHQFADQGNQHVDNATLAAYLDIVEWTSRLFSELVNLSSLDAAAAVIDPKGSDMRLKAQAQILSTWLNFANGAVGWDEMIDTDYDRVPDMPFYAVMEQAESSLLNADSSHEELVQAKDLAKTVILMHEGSGVCSDGEKGEDKK